jgi:hypothetical protein
MYWCASAPLFVSVKLHVAPGPAEPLQNPVVLSYPTSGGSRSV